MDNYPKPIKTEHPYRKNEQFSLILASNFDPYAYSTVLNL